MDTMVDDIAVLAYNDDTGRNRVQHLAYALAGGVLAELVLQQRIDIDSSGRVSVVSAVPTRDTVIDACLQRISQDRPRKAKSWVKKLSRGLKNTVLDSLVERRILTHQRGAFLGLIPLNRYHPADGTRKAELRSRLESAIAAEAASDARTAVLAGTVWAASMYKAALPGYSRFGVRKILKSINDGPFATDATRQAVKAIRKAVSDANAAAANAGGGGGG
ncbi:MAG: GOLPH3/VPS74 family protein [Stackebrandtia sp.]